MADPVTQVPQQCSHCGKAALYGIEDRCRACYFPAAQLAPNVRLASRPEQVVALQGRYQAARDKAEREGLASSLQRLEDTANRAAAVINVPVGLAHDLFFRDVALYAPYEAQVKGELRAPAAPEHDRRRRAVGSLLYGSYHENIVYAALSADGRGLTSYGPVHLELDEVAVAYRSTVLEENSYEFAERHGLTPAEPLPPGFLARWEDRGKLAVAKLADRLQAEMDEEACALLLLHGEGRRHSDEFLEVHIYGNFNLQAVQGVSLRGDSYADLSEVQVVQLKALRERLQKKSLAWREL
jgi:hypothetical protein